jgi:uncharacterized protein YbjT (DUF2867 family)
MLAFDRAVCFLLVICATCASALAPTKVIVSGAAGRTGGLVFKKLLGSEKFSPVGLVRTNKSGKKLNKYKPQKDQVVVADVTDVDSLARAINESGAEKYILCTSAVPKIKIWSLIKVIVLKIFRQTARPEFYFNKNGDPYNVDWLGAKNQIDAAKKAGIKQFVFVSSMGGTQPDNFLNTIGRIAGDDLSGNILLWKRKAEQYLIQSGIPYTIVHPGGLIDKAGGEREVILGVDDELLKEKTRSIPRDDVAEVCIQALSQSGALNRAIDIIAREPGVGTPTKDWKAFFSGNKNCKY